jgi:curli biogenesis system outer membrane secretion channel CsgG
MKGILFALSSAAALAVITISSGCSTTSTETAERDALTANVGNYPPPPSGIERARVGVPPFNVSNTSGHHEAQLETMAADQMTTLLFNSQRFDVIERAQLDQLLKEQNLEGVVKGSELAKSAQVQGVDYLLLGKVTNLRIKAEKSAHGFGLGSIPIPGAGGQAAGLFDYKNKESKVTAECGVDIRITNPTTGKVDAAHFGEFKRIDSIGSMGIEILGANATADADLQISDDDKGKIMRLALDEALRKMLPQVDKALLARAKDKSAAPAAAAIPVVAPPAAVAPAAVAPSGTAPEAGSAPPAPAAGAKFCAGCGAKLEAGAKFCPGCGAKVGG